MSDISFPKIIHQTFKNEKALPNLYIKCRRLIKRTYDEYQYTFYSDKDIQNFMKQYFPSFKSKVFDKLPTTIMQIDVFRYCLLYHFGGVYSDMDYQVLRKYNFSDFDITLPLCDFEDAENFRLGNCIIASKPNHVFWKTVLDEIENNLNVILSSWIKHKKDRRKLKEYVLKYTGPVLLTDVYKKYFINDPSFNLPERNAFHPDQPKTAKDFKQMTKNSDIYGFHHCSGSWLLSLPKSSQRHQRQIKI